MSARAVDVVLQYSKSRGDARVVMILLADSANEGGWTTCDMNSIAAKANLSRSELDQIVSDLQEVACELVVGQGPSPLASRSWCTIQLVLGKGEFSK